jgi:ribonuclease D
MHALTPTLIALEPIILENDISRGIFDQIRNGQLVAWDLETTGLDWKRDRIALCQLYLPTKEVFLIRVSDKEPPYLRQLLESNEVHKVFHHAAFDLRFMCREWSAVASNVVCTKIASKILDPAERDHSLQALLNRHLNLRVEKSAVRTSDWFSKQMTIQQIAYAIEDVAHLFDLMDVLKSRLETVHKWQLAQECFAFLPAEVKLQVMGYDSVFSY